MDFLSLSNTDVKKLQEEFVSADAISAGEDEEEETGKHIKLIEAINSLDSKRRRKIINRTEASATISEFNLAEVGKERVKVRELLTSLKETPSHVTIKKQLRTVINRKKVLPVPLHQEEAEKVRRGIAYQKVCADVAKWDSIVEANRTAEQLVFPLKQPDISIRPASEHIKKFQPQTQLELEVSKILSSSDNVLTKDSFLTPAEEKELQSLSLEEAKIRHENLQKARALLSYQEAKFRRQKKIKSKKYHRILKHQRLKEQSKKFEELQKTDPKAAMEEFEKIDKLRILERMTLKHKNTGKWAKQRMLRARHDPHVREALMNQLELSKKLTQKVNCLSDEEEEENSCASDDDNVKKANMLMDGSVLEDKSQKQASLSPDKEKAVVFEDGVLEYDTLKGMLQPSRNSEVKKKLKRKLKLINEESANENSSTDIHYREERPLIAGQPGLHYSDDCRFEEEETLIEESLERKQTMKDFDISGEEQCEEKKESSQKIKSNKRSRKRKQKQKISSSSPEEDSGNIINVETVTLKSALPDITRIGEESLDDSSDNDEKINIQEAFQDDELFGQFRQEKQTVIEKDKPKSLNLFHPGWGSWAGPGIKIPRQKKRRFIIKPSPTKPRRDRMLGNVIINEKQDEKLKKHQVNEVPFPFVSVQQFESSIRQPIGNTWNPETAFQRLIAPKVVTQLGKVIDPIDDSALVKNK